MPVIGRDQDLRNWVALKDDVQCGDEVHDSKHCHDSVLRIDVSLPVLCNPHQHIANRKLNGDDGDTVEDLEHEEPEKARLHILLVAWLQESERMYADAVEGSDQAGY